MGRLEDLLEEVSGKLGQSRSEDRVREIARQEVEKILAEERKREKEDRRWWLTFLLLVAGAIGGVVGWLSSLLHRPLP